MDHEVAYLLQHQDTLGCLLVLIDRTQAASLIIEACMTCGDRYSALGSAGRPPFQLNKLLIAKSRCNRRGDA